MFGGNLDSEGSSFIAAIEAEIIGSRTEDFVTMNALCNPPEKILIPLPPLPRNVVGCGLKISRVPASEIPANGKHMSRGP